MSYGPYNPPPQQPGGYPDYQPYGQPPSPALVAARRAGVTMIVLGSIQLLIGLLGFVVVSQLDSISTNPQMQEAFRQYRQMAADAGTTIKFLFIAQSTLLAVVGLLLLVLGIFVRRGSRGVVITSIVVTGLLLLMALWNLLVSFAGGPMQMCMPLVLAVLLGLTLVWLIQALRGDTPGAPGGAVSYPPYPGQGYGPPPPPPGQGPIVRPPDDRDRR